MKKARQLNAWIISQRAHAVANGLPVISVNRVGHEPDPSGQTNGILFWGNSFVAGPQRGISGTSRKRSPGEHSSGNRYGTFGKRSSLVAFPS